MQKKGLISITILLLIIGLSLGFILAAQEQNQNQESDQITIQEQSQEQNQEQALISGQGNSNANPITQGRHILTNGQQLEVKQLTKTKTQLRIKNISVDCECNLTQEQVQNRTKLNLQLSNGRNAEIKIMPDTASETALNRLRLKVCNESNNCTLQLKETAQIRVGNQTQSRAAYEIQIERHYKLLGMFKTKAQTRVQVDAENGNIIAVNKPWWSFLASVDEGTD